MTQLRGTELLVRAVRQSDKQYFYTRHLFYKELLPQSLADRVAAQLAEQMIRDLLSFEDPEGGSVGDDAVWTGSTETAISWYDEEAE